MKRLNQVKVILVEPAGSRNVGSVARVMKNMGLFSLILVNPHCDPYCEEAQHMAVHAKDVLNNANIVSSLPEALNGCHRAIATTGRTCSLQTPLETPKNALPWLLTDNLTSALIFGPEDRGLSNEELNYAQRFVCIPANPDYSSLNLAQAVAICVYELYQVSLENVERSPITTNIATLDQMEGYYQHLEKTLLESGYLYPHTAASRMEKFRHLFGRIELTEDEVFMLRGILRQFNWMWQKK
ncbi:MAG: RNA methyltransferase [Microcystaceae cyanobacterium]